MRAIEVLLLIERNSGGLRVPDMAERLGATTRAIYRDLQILQALRFPLYTDRNGRESYWKIEPDYQSRLSVPFSLSELVSLYLAQDSIRPLEGTIFHDSLNSLFDKVKTALPKLLFRQMADLRASFFSGIPARKDYRVHREFIKAIQEAIESRKTLQLLYHPLNQSPGERRIDPYAVHLRNGTLYLIGHCHMRQDIRFFVVDRMRKIRLTDQPFTIPPGFSLEKYLRHSFGMFREELVRVKVRFHKSLTRYLLERRWHASQKAKKLKDGSLELAFEVAGTKEIKTWILGFGSLATVLEPAALLNEIKGDLKKTLALYGRL
jgi:predicted DNA-binding transcriptional regulator YafY